MNSLWLLLFIVKLYSRINIFKKTYTIKAPSEKFISMRLMVRLKTALCDISSHNKTGDSSYQDTSQKSDTDKSKKRMYMLVYLNGWPPA